MQIFNQIKKWWNGDNEKTRANFSQGIFYVSRPWLRKKWDRVKKIKLNLNDIVNGLIVVVIGLIVGHIFF